MRSRFIAASGALALVLALATPSAAIAAPPTLAEAIEISDTTLAIGETATVTFRFDQAVTGFTISDVAAPNAELSNLSSSDGGNTWTATLTPEPDTQDDSNVLTLNLGSVQNAGGEAGAGATDSPNYAVDTVRPALATAIMFTDRTLRAGETATLTFVFSERLKEFDVADVTVPNGQLVGLGSADGGLTWTATLVPDAGVSNAVNALTLDYSGIMDLAGNRGYGVAFSMGYAIDTVPPTATVSLSDTALAPGETATVTFVFSEPVVGFDDTDITAPNGALSTPTSIDGGLSYTATFTPSANATVVASTITVNLAGVADLAGNPGLGSATSAAFAIDTVPAAPAPVTPAPVTPTPLTPTPDATPAVTTPADAASTRLPVTGGAPTASLLLGLVLTSAGLLLTVARRRWTVSASA